MAHPQVADGEDGLEIRRVIANILSKQLWTADRWWPCHMWVGDPCDSRNELTAFIKDGEVLIG
jgi:hypothetical protein